MNNSFDKSFLDRLGVLADAAKYDASCSSSGAKRDNKDGLGNSTGMGICHSYTPDGRCVSLLKILLTNHCIFDCGYCINRASSDVKRASFTPGEVVKLTLDFYRRNYIEGLFLSSGVKKGPDETMQELIWVARTLRQIHKFNGYIHLKAIAGASLDLTEEAGRWADRVSANIELPTQSDLNVFAPAKTHREVEDTMGHLKKLKIARAPEKPKITNLKRVFTKPGRLFLPAGQSTQMIVGATATGDKTILDTANRFYGEFKLKRVYYSAYSPIPKANQGLPQSAPPLMREHRLYQADWLLRFYEFKVEELAYADGGNLDLEIDPKLAWALQNRHLFPLDINKASRGLLLRIPGVGVKSVDRILQARKFRRLRLDDLKLMNVSLTKVTPFVMTADNNPGTRLLDTVDLRARVVQPVQLSLFGGTA